MSHKTILHADWKAEARRRYGDHAGDWKFRCPVCGYVATASEWTQRGAQSSVAFSCVGRWLRKGEVARDVYDGRSTVQPCNYAGGGLFKLNPVHVIMRGESAEAGGRTRDPHVLQVFDFADDPLVPKETTDARPATD